MTMHLQLVARAVVEDKMVRLILDQGQLEIRRLQYHHKVMTAEQDGSKTALVVVEVVGVRQQQEATHHQVQAETAVWVQHRP